MTAEIKRPDQELIKRCFASETDDFRHPILRYQRAVADIDALRRVVAAGYGYAR